MPKAGDTGVSPAFFFSALDSRLAFRHGAWFKSGDSEERSMMTKRLVLAGLMAAIVGSGCWLMTGCESAEGTDGINISPSSVTVGGASTNVSPVVVFTASVKGALALPLSWRVSNSTLGTIVSQSGSNATYRANEGRKGDNVITASDQYGNEGSAVVMQE
jgi:hypothetical protein